MYTPKRGRSTGEGPGAACKHRLRGCADGCRAGADAGRGTGASVVSGVGASGTTVTTAVSTAGARAALALACSRDAETVVRGFTGLAGLSLLVFVVALGLVAVFAETTAVAGSVAREALTAVLTSGAGRVFAGTLAGVPGAAPAGCATTPVRGGPSARAGVVGSGTLGTGRVTGTTATTLTAGVAVVNGAAVVAVRRGPVAAIAGSRCTASEVSGARRGELGSSKHGVAPGSMLPNTRAVVNYRS